MKKQLNSFFFIGFVLNTINIYKINITNLDTAFYAIAGKAGGTWLKNLTIIATAFSWGIANALAAQTAISRILYSMARDRKLPAVLAKVHPKFKTPYISTILVAVVL